MDPNYTKSETETITAFAKLLIKAVAAEIAAETNAASAPPPAVKPKSQPKTKGNPYNGNISPEALLGYIRANPGLRSEQLRAALLWPKDRMKKTLEQLRQGAQVTTRGERRGTTYYAKQAAMNKQNAARRPKAIAAKSKKVSKKSAKR